MNEKECILGVLKQVADAVIKTFGRNCEVAVHDLSDLGKSLTYIAGDVTKRKPGAPITDMALKALSKEGREIKNRYDYKTITDDGRELKSTTIFIRDSQGDPVAAFCINFDSTDYLNIIRSLEVFTKTSDAKQTHELTETFALSINDTIDALFEQAVSEIGKQPPTMSTDEKMRVVKTLEREGTFKIKGAVNEVALKLGVSNYTVYNYLKKIRAAQAIDKANVIV
ncbi:MAG: PAS domain-containing protein [Desulfobacterales bacterium]|jgi:predicted transcriptional regulator YheO